MHSHSDYRALVQRIGLSVLLGGGLFALGAWLQAFQDKQAVRGVIAYTDDLILALVAAAVVYVYESRRESALRKRLQAIAAINHHVRNALQAITFSQYAEQSKQLQLVSQSTQRIEWALNEILPLTGQDSPGTSLGGSSAAGP